MPWPDDVTLSGRHASLEPLAPPHLAGLTEAVRDGELWNLWYTSVPSPAEMADEIDRRIGLRESGKMLPFTVRDLDGRIVGMTTYMDLDAHYKPVEIGSTWYARRVQRTPLNTECKSMLMSHAFEQLGCIAVEFRTSFFNQPSRRAIERLGAKLDGILRSHQLHSDGTLRDTCVYSVIASEWPTVRSHLASLQ